MTRQDATKYFMVGDIIGFFDNKPMYMSPSEVFVECIEYAQGSELDCMIGKSLSLNREFLGYWESDVDYRNRGKTHAYLLDDALKSYRGFSNSEKSKNCQHNYTFYQGLFETYEYCISCNERKS